MGPPRGLLRRDHIRHGLDAVHLVCVSALKLRLGGRVEGGGGVSWLASLKMRGRFSGVWRGVFRGCFKEVVGGCLG